ncbi:MAG: hypothetical protein F6J97_13610 [Leptolyngbya sp. SIO4C1]|nr:hypothetical protein [Leptolyngbya sp. SIO4C1]
MKQPSEPRPTAAAQLDAQVNRLEAKTQIPSLDQATKTKIRDLTALLKSRLSHQQLSARAQQELAALLSLLPSFDQRSAHLVDILDLSIAILLEAGSSEGSSPEAKQAKQNLALVRKTRQQLAQKLRGYPSPLEAIVTGIGGPYYRLISGLSWFFFIFVICPLLGVGATMLALNLLPGNEFRAIAELQHDLLKKVSQDLGELEGYIDESQRQRSALEANALVSAQLQRQLNSVEIERLPLPSLTSAQQQELKAAAQQLEDFAALGQLQAGQITPLQNSLAQAIAALPEASEVLENRLIQLKARLSEAGPINGTLRTDMQSIAAQLRSEASLANLRSSVVFFQQESLELPDQVDDAEAGSIQRATVLPKLEQLNREIQKTLAAFNLTTAEPSADDTAIPEETVGGAARAEAAGTAAPADTVLNPNDSLMAETNSTIRAVLANSLDNNVMLVALVVSFGALGSAVSVIVRSQQFIEQAGQKDLFLVGFLRPLVGMAFAVFIFALIESGIFANLIRLNQPEDIDTTQLYVAIAFIAGFSERLVMNVVTRTEDTITGSSD